MKSQKKVMAKNMMNEIKAAKIRIMCRSILAVIVIGLDIYFMILSQWLHLLIVTLAGILLLELINLIGKKKQDTNSSKTKGK